MQEENSQSARNACQDIDQPTFNASASTTAPLSPMLLLPMFSERRPVLPAKLVCKIPFLKIAAMVIQGVLPAISGAGKVA